MKHQVSHDGVTWVDWPFKFYRLVTGETASPAITIPEPQVWPWGTWGTDQRSTPRPTGSPIDVSDLPPGSNPEGSK